MNKTKMPDEVLAVVVAFTNTTRGNQMTVDTDFAPSAIKRLNKMRRALVAWNKKGPNIATYLKCYPTKHKKIPKSLIETGYYCTTSQTTALCKRAKINIALLDKYSEQLGKVLK